MVKVIIENFVKIYFEKSGFGVIVVNNINFIIEDCEFMVFVGLFGCGKFIIFCMIVGLEEILGGSIFIDGCVVNNVLLCDCDIVMVF